MKRQSIPLGDICVSDAFFAPRAQNALEISLAYMWEVLSTSTPDDSGALNNFRALAAGGGEFRGFRFADSDVYKWLEAASYALSWRDSKALRARINEAVELVVKAQRENGYINTYISLTGREPFADLMSAHELYCAGHLFEAACAHFEATGERTLLNAAMRFADLLCAVFGAGEGQKRGYPGHQEAELALVRLCEVTGAERYRALARFFLSERGRQPHYFDIEQQACDNGKKDGYYSNHGEKRYSYQQAHAPVTEQTEAVGHAVRELYMIAGLADAADGEADELFRAAKRLFQNVVSTQMYITGGVGAMCDGEAFTFPYDLPNDRMYCETCASIGLIMAAKRLSRTDADAAYSDVIERALYNVIPAGVGLDGKSFFYINPMQMWPERSRRRHDSMEIKALRQPWYGCACCPPNAARTFLSIGSYIYSRTQTALYVELFVKSSVRAAFSGGELTLCQRGDYPYAGRVEIDVTVSGADMGEATIYIRRPKWCERVDFTLGGAKTQPPEKDGYFVFSAKALSGATLLIDMAMRAKFVYCIDKVPYNAGRAALMRGPLVYCAEGADNGADIWQYAIDADTPAAEEKAPAGLPDGTVTLRAAAVREKSAGDALYSFSPPQSEASSLAFVPYCVWGNRAKTEDEAEMAVWIRYRN